MPEMLLVETFVVRSFRVPVQRPRFPGGLPKPSCRDSRRFTVTVTVTREDTTHRPIWAYLTQLDGLHQQALQTPLQLEAL